MAHHGCLAIRGDSGNPVEIVTETVFKLWEIFGGTVNSKGYKVLDPHIKALYGDSITPQRCEAVYKILMEHGFAINNVSLGVGSFSMQCLETMDGGEKTYAPYTRDTFGIAVKATYAEDADGKPIMIFKNPKTDSGHFKKSQRGCCISTDLVQRDDRFGCGIVGGVDFLTENYPEKFNNVITNPPFSLAKEFAEKALEVSTGKVILFAKIQFLEGRQRKDFFATHPPKAVYVFSKRVNPLRNGLEVDENGKHWSSTMCFAWFVWEHGYTGEPCIRWI